MDCPSPPIIDGDMVVRYLCRGLTVPRPCPQPNEVLIKVEMAAVLNSMVRPSQGLPKPPHRFAKLLFFVLHEGVWLTIDKIRAVRLHESIASHRKLVIAWGRSVGSDNCVIGVGPQPCPYAEYQCFPTQMTISTPCGDGLPGNVMMRIADYLEGHADIREDVATYSPFAGKILKLSLEEIVRDSEPLTCPSRALSFVAPDRCGSAEAEKAETRCVSAQRQQQPALFLAGAGSYTLSYVLRNMPGIVRHTVIDANPMAAELVRRRYGFRYSESSGGPAFVRMPACSTPVLIVATYHSTHVEVAEAAIQQCPQVRVLIEKPPVSNRAQLERLLCLRSQGAYIEIGYNRRYSRFLQLAKQYLSRERGPLSVTCIVKELKLHAEHWYYWPSQNTRVTGNMCHWIDLGCCLIDRKPVMVTVSSPQDGSSSDEITATVMFEGGSQLTIVATSRGDSLRGVQEYIDIRRGYMTIVIDDFLSMRVCGHGQQLRYRSLIRNKGHSFMYRHFRQNIVRDRPPSYNARDLLFSSEAFLTLSDMVGAGQVGSSQINWAYWQAKGFSWLRQTACE
jgi:predicted dehydrogenase